MKRREPSSERASSLLGRLRQVLTGPRAAEVPKQRLNDVLSSDRAILAVHASAAAQEQAASPVQAAAPMFVDDDPITLEIVLSELAGGETAATELEAESLDAALLEAEQIGAELLDVEQSPRAPLLSELELAELSPAPESAPVPLEAARPEPVPEPAPPVVVAAPPAPRSASRSASTDDDEVYEEPIRTRSMARLLAGQGHRARALAIYDALLAVDGSDASLRAEADALRRAG